MSKKFNLREYMTDNKKNNKASVLDSIQDKLRRKCDKSLTHEEIESFIWDFLATTKGHKVIMEDIITQLERWENDVL